MTHDEHDTRRPTCGARGNINNTAFSHAGMMMTGSTATIRCPICGCGATEPAASDRRAQFYDCRGCGAVLRPSPGDCCVFCSYSDQPCSPVPLEERLATPVER